MNADKARLSSISVQANDPRVQEVIRISGQALGGAHKVMVEELLKKPRISHRQVFVFPWLIFPIST